MRTNARDTVHRYAQPPRWRTSPRLWRTWTPWLTYAIRATHTGLIKIGKCHLGTEYNRFKAAEMLIGEPCEWLGYLDVGERDAHRAMREFWVWREWFEPTDELADYLIAHLRDDPPRSSR